ncbi:tRNA pseudouridine(55) synthase TruB [Corynebacterium pseudodiphtheriticum]|uniref:tRNA pseudouridine(55) synthase TruB n=1 Tax=Corynebacterium pseudodiphtheriticum TaxID=37637 RepID=UPI00254EC255|nr:tRNA pseudouridine(55) synthase TruB [Corynebacterium pseudodiphtheriticum]MDK8562444.1 tRNA pseudouridine(55) synthase TruB [Corynebacterium pseudodiphtheriticum]
MNSATDFSQPDPLDGSGLVVVDKPAGMTSHDVVGKLRRIFRTKKVGHAGTLDPMATGVLVAGIKRGTKFLAHMVAADKTYQATIRLGAATTTDDAEGDFLPATTIEDGLNQEQVSVRLSGLSDDDIAAAVASWTGTVEQVPAKVSAVKIAGKRAHQRVREGEDVEIPARTVTINQFTVHSIRRGSDDETGTAFIDIACTVTCSSGTYIRSLARDIGSDLGVGGHLTQLRRTHVGPYGLSDAATLDELADDPQLSLSLDDALQRSYPHWQVTEQQATDLSMGKRLPACGLDGVVVAIAPNGQAIALVTETTGARAEIKTVFVARPSTL